MVCALALAASCGTEDGATTTLALGPADAATAVPAELDVVRAWSHGTLVDECARALAEFSDPDHPNDGGSLAGPTKGWLVLQDIPELLAAGEALANREIAFADRTIAVATDSPAVYSHVVGSRLAGPATHVVLADSTVDILRVLGRLDGPLVLTYVAPVGTEAPGDPYVGYAQNLVYERDGELYVHHHRLRGPDCVAAQYLLDLVGQARGGPVGDLVLGRTAESVTAIANLAVRETEVSDEEWRTGMIEQWRASDPAHRVLDPLSPALPDEIRASITEYRLFVVVPDGWRASESFICSRTPVGLGPDCHRIAGGFEVEGRWVVPVWVVQYRNEPIEMIAANPARDPRERIVDQVAFASFDEVVVSTEEGVPVLVLDDGSTQGTVEDVVAHLAAGTTVRFEFLP